MTTFVFAMMLLVIAVFYGWANYNQGRNDKVIGVEAGPTANMAHGALGCTSEPRKVLKMQDGSYVSTSGYTRILVHGGCMKKKGVEDGSQWLVQPIRRRRELQGQITSGDVLLLYIKDKDLYKIREFECFDADQTLKTLYYEENGDKHYSTTTHSRDAVIGVLRYPVC